VAQERKVLVRHKIIGKVGKEIKKKEDKGDSSSID
jgi:hypothetical protein